MDYLLDYFTADQKGHKFSRLQSESAGICATVCRQESKKAEEGNDFTLNIITGIFRKDPKVHV